MAELTTKEFNEIYKKYFKEYFDKPLKEDEKESIDEKVAVKIDNQIYQKEIVKIKDDAKPISKFKDEQIINNPKRCLLVILNTKQEIIL